MTKFRAVDGPVDIFINGEKWTFTSRFKKVDDGFAAAILRRHPMVEEGE